MISMFLSQTPTACRKESLEQLLEAVVSHADPAGRVISELFQKLPSKVVSAAAFPCGNIDSSFLKLAFCKSPVVSFRESFFAPLMFPSLPPALSRLLCSYKGAH